MLHPNVLSLLIQMRRSGHLQILDWIADLGDTQLDLRGHESLIKDFIETFSSNSRELSAKEIQKLESGSAKKIYEMIGARYICFDTAKPIDPSTIKDSMHTFDLNFDSILVEHKCKFDLVNNLGTTEHVINQLNCFKCCHSLTKPQGYMLHFVPCHGFSDQYYFNYQPSFFLELARANRYLVIGMWLAMPGYQDHLIPWNTNLLQVLNWEICYNQYANIAVLLKKTR